MSKKLKKQSTHNPPRVKMDEDIGAFRIDMGCKQEVAENIRNALEACGTDDMHMMSLLLNQIAGVLPPALIKHEVFQNGAMAMLKGIDPQNEMEALLAAQMVACHLMAMETAKRAMLEDQTIEGVTENLNRANKSMRTFTAQVEALAKLRGQTKTVTVKHVTVANGGQAVIGNVHHGGNTHGKK